MRLWNVIQKFVRTMLMLHYWNPENVLNDEELQVTKYKMSGLCKTTKTIKYSIKVSHVDYTCKLSVYVMVMWAMPYYTYYHSHHMRSLALFINSSGKCTGFG